MTKLFFFFVTLFCVAGTAFSQHSNREAATNLIFDQMKMEGVDTTKPLLYGYFFYNKDQTKLEQLKDTLLKENYSLVRLEYVVTKEYILHVEKVEVHSRTSMLARENQLDMLAKFYQIDGYDRWDVGNADPNKPLVSSNDLKQFLEGKSSVEIYQIANDLYASEKHYKAIIAYQKCIDRNYLLDTCYFKLGNCWITLGQTETGIEKLEKAIDINPNYFNAYFNIAATFYAEEAYQECIDYYEKASFLDPKNDSVYYGIAIAYYVLGQHKVAKAYCEKALKYNSKHALAKALLKEIKKVK